MTYLYAAYIATWVIHGTYLAILVRKYSKIRREMQSLKETNESIYPPNTQRSQRI